MNKRSYLKGMLTLLVLFYTTIVIGQAQPFPGGVSTNLTLWYKADAGVTSSAGAVSQWNNSATSSYNVLQGTPDNRPLLLSSGMNFNPVLRFDGSNDVLSVASMPQNVTTTGSGTYGSSMFVVYRRRGTGTSGTALFDHTNTANSSISNIRVNSDFRGTLMNVVFGTTSLPDTNRRNISSFVGNTGSGTVFNNGISASTAISGSLNTSSTSATFYLGGRVPGSSSYFNGDIAEIIIYNAETSDRAKIESYLALKYGITLGNTSSLVNYVSSNNTTLWTGNSTYQNNIVGLVRDDGSGLYQKQSRSQNTGLQPILCLGDLKTSNAANTSTLTNMSALVWGSDNGGTNFSTTYTSGPLTHRINRVWYVQETGTIGKVRVYFQQNEIQSGFAGLKLLVSTSSNFTPGSSTQEITLHHMLIDGQFYYSAEFDFSTGQYISIAGLQTGPGGVTTGLKFWFRGDRGADILNNEVVSYLNQAPNGGTLSKSTAGTAPFTESGLNYNPIVGYRSGFLSNSNNIIGGFTPSSGLEMFEVSKFIAVPSTSTSTSMYLGATSSSSTNAIEMYMPNSSTRGIGPWQSNGSSTKDFTSQLQNNYSLNNYSWPNTSSTNSISSLTASTMGMPITSFLTSPSGSWDGSTNRIILGASQHSNGNPRYHEIDQAELILMNTSLNTTDKQKINSYLAVKYGFTLGTPASPYTYVNSAGTTIWNGGASNAFQNRIFGIGMDLKSDLEQLISTTQNITSSDPRLILAIQQNFTLSNLAEQRSVLPNNDGSFVLIGDNNGTTATSTLSNAICPTLPADLLVLNRRYRLEQTNMADPYWLHVPTGQIALKADLMLLCGDNIDGSGNISGNVFTVEGIASSGGFDFPMNLKNGVYYFAIVGRTSAACAECRGAAKIVAAQGAQWTSSAQSANTTGFFNVGDPGSGMVTARHTVLYTGTTEPFASSNPRNWNGWTHVRKSGTTNTGVITYTTEFGNSAHAALGVKARFSIKSSLTEAINVKYFEIRGRDCNNKIVNPKISGSKELLVDFSKPISKIEIIWYEKKNRDKSNTNDLYISPITITCAASLPPLPDKVNVVQSFIEESVQSCNEAVMVLDFYNSNCGPKTIHLSSPLPADLEYVAASFQTNPELLALNSGATISYAAQACSLSNFVVPAGESSISFRVAHKQNSSANYNVQASYTVDQGLNNPNPYLSDGNMGLSGFQQATISFVQSTPSPMPEVKLTADTTSGCNIIEYTVEFTNTTGNPISGLYFETQLDAAGGQVIHTNPSSQMGGSYGDGVTSPSAIAATNFSLTNITIPVGTSQFTFKTDARLYAQELYNSVILTNPTPSCEGSATIVSNYLPTPCASCFAGTQEIVTRNVWFAGGATGKANNELRDITLEGPAPETGPLKADIFVTYPNNVEYKPNSYPRRHGLWAHLTRRDKLNGASGKVTYRVNLKDAAGNPIAAKPSFPMIGITKKRGQAEKVTVYGLTCDGTTIVKPVIVPGKGRPDQRRYSISDNVVTGIHANNDYHWFSGVNVFFEKEVSSIIIEWEVIRDKPRQTINHLYIGNMKFQCGVEYPSFPDEVYILSNFQAASVPSCEEAYINIAIDNLNCTNKTIDIASTLPSGLVFIQDSYGGPGTPSFSQGNTAFSLNGLNVSPGKTYLSLAVAPTSTAGGTYNVEFTYSVVNGTNIPSPYKSFDGSSRKDANGNLLFGALVEFTASTPIEKPIITLSVNECFSLVDEKELEYTVQIQNLTNTPMTNLYFEELLSAAETLVPNSITFQNFANNGTTSLQADPDDNKIYEILIEGLGIAANSTATLSYKVNVNKSFVDSIGDLEKRADHTNFLESQVSIGIGGDGEGECEAAATALSNILEVNRCTTCEVLPKLVGFSYKKESPAYCTRLNGYDYYKYPDDASVAIMSFKKNGNNQFAPNAYDVKVDFQGTLTANNVYTPSNKKYYQIDNGTQTMRIAHRINSVIAPGSFTTNGGIIVRVYFDSSELTDLINDKGVGDEPIKQHGWYKSSINNPEDVVKNIRAAFPSMSSGMDVYPIASGKEEGIDYVEFLTQTFSSFGYYAQTDVSLLSVHDISLTATHKPATNANLLTWTVLPNLNPKRMELYYSREGVTWEKIYTQNNMLPSKEQTQHTFVHELPAFLQGAIYYKVIAVDNTEKEIISNMASVLVSTARKESDIILYPNPVAKTLYLEGDNIEEINIVSIHGARIKQVKNTGLNRVQIDLSELSNATYFIQVRNHSGELKSFPIVVFKE